MSSRRPADTQAVIQVGLTILGGLFILRYLLGGTDVLQCTLDLDFMIARRMHYGPAQRLANHETLAHERKRRAWGGATP